MSEAVMSDTVQRQALAEELDSFNCRVAQPTDGPLFTRTPQSAMKAAHWKASDLERLLEKIGASASLLIATITFEPFMPARCWIAPEMPIAK